VVAELGDDLTKYRLQKYLPTGPRSYDHYLAEKQDGFVLSIEQKPNGDCVYCGVDSCQIYEDRPVVCKLFNCVEVVRDIAETEPDKLGALGKGVMEAGLERLSRQERRKILRKVENSLKK
jgi:Fe-S-cluster containining protein